MALPPLLLKFNALRTEVYRESGNAVELNNAYASCLVEYSAQMVRLSTRLAEMESSRVPGEGGVPGGSIAPSGYEKDGATIAPITIVPEGVQPPEDAAISIIVANSGQAGV